MLELGAGVGLTGVLLAALGARVTLTDLPDVTDLISANISANRPALSRPGAGSAEAAPLPWGDADALARFGTAALGPAAWDHIICADVVYRRELFSPLLATLRACAGPNTQLVFGASWPLIARRCRLLTPTLCHRSPSLLPRGPAH